MAEKTLLADLPENVEEEVSLLYRMGIDIDEIEYIIRIKTQQAY